MHAAAWIPLAAGPEGIRETLRQLSALKSHYGSIPLMRALALHIAGSSLDDDQRGHVDRLAQFVRRSVVYVADPINAEFVQAPYRMLLDIYRHGQTSGDCDDHVLLFASLVESLGVPCDIAGVNLAGDFISAATPVDHVIAIAYPYGKPVEIDLCAKRGNMPTYAEKVIVPALG